MNGNAGTKKGGGDASPIKFFRRFSSVKVNYEKERRKTLSRFQQQGLQISIGAPKLFQDKAEIRKRLRISVERYSLPELYVKMICALAPDSNAFISHLKHVFRLTDQEHAQLIDVAKMTKLPQRIINLEIVEAKNIPAKDPNGLSDPFCVLFVNSRDVAQRTKVDPKTLNPVWKQYFTFKVNDPAKDVLHVEVMDYNEEDEPLRDRIRRFKDIKSPSTFGILLKEIANARSAQELIGSLKIPVSSISSETIEKWYRLKNHEDRGELYLRMALGYNKSKEAASEEFLQIVHFLVAHELDKETTLATPFYWDEHFHMWSQYILRQFKWQGGLKPKDIVLAKWRAYTVVNAIFPLNPNMMCLLMDAVLKRALMSEYDTREMTRFWDCTTLLVDSILKFLTEIHDVLPCPVTVLHTFHMLKSIDTLNQFLDEPPNDNWGQLPFTRSGIIDRVCKAIRDGADKFYIKVFADSTYEEIKNDQDPLYLAIERLVKMGQILHEDIRLGVTTVQTDCKGILNIDYLAITFQVYDEQFGKMVKYIVEDYNDNLIETNDDSENDDQMEEDSPSVKIALAILQLYIAVKNFADLAPPNYLDGSQSEFSIKRGYHDWFYHSVAMWINNLRRKIMKWVKNSVDFSETDSSDYKLSKVDDQSSKDVPCSASAIDTAQMFHEINKFWIALGWQNPKQAYTIVRKLLEELYDYLIFYAAQLLEAVRSRMPPSDKRYNTAAIHAYLKKACMDINNINYVKEQVEILAEQLNVSNIIDKIAVCDADFEESNQCEQSIDTIKANMISEVESVTGDIMKNAIKMVTPKFRQLLLEMAREEIQQQFKSYLGNMSSLRFKNLIEYIDNCLMILNRNLEAHNFRHMIKGFWTETVNVVDDMVNVGIETGKTSEFFQRFNDLIDDLHALFWPREVCQDINSETETKCEHYDNLQRRLSYLKSSLEDLKLKYYENRHKRQQSTSLKTNEHGSITVRICFLEDKSELTVEILNARNLKSYDSNNLSDPYAVTTLVPKECFPTAPRYVTKCQKETLYPMFDETFTYKITEEERQSGFLQITLFDYDLLGKDELMGEAFFPLKDTTKLTNDYDMVSLPQLHLVLSKPDEDDSKYLECFYRRLWDKKGIEFAKQERGNRQ